MTDAAAFPFTPQQRALLADLRSGEYRQITGNLYRMLDNKQEGYCFMGVVAEGLRRRGGIPGCVIERDQYGFSVHAMKEEDDQYRRQNNLPPQEIWEFLGFRDAYGMANFSGLSSVDRNHISKTLKLQSSLVGANDSMVDFETLANLIEEFPTVFLTNLDFRAVTY